MGRNGHKEKIELLKNKFNVDKVWSWSEVSCYLQDEYEYFLKYVKHIKPDKTTSKAYLELGSCIHDLLQKYYEGDIKKEEIAKRFKDRFEELQILQIGFTSDETKDAQIAYNYYNNLIDYCENFKPLKGNNLCETTVYTKVGNRIFMGYIDMLNINDGVLMQQDFKTSTIYKGNKIEQNSQQLKLYTIGLHQTKGIEYDKIKTCWNFLKYYNITVQQIGKTKDGQLKFKDRIVERREYGKVLKNDIKKWLKKFNYEPKEIEALLDEVEYSNSLECLPSEIQDKFVFNDCYVYVDIDENVEKEFIEQLSQTCDEIEEKIKLYEQNGDDNVFMYDVNEKKNSFYLYNLCGYSEKYHKPFANYKKQLEDIEKQKEEESFVDMSNHKQVKVDDIDNFFNF